MQPPPLQPIGQPASSASGGFTLIELMIAVVVIAILSAIALPAYQKQLMRGRRSDAISGLGGLQQAQERYRSNNQSYAQSFDLLYCSSTSTTPCPYAAGTTSIGSNNGYYTLTIAPFDATTQGGTEGYTITAVPVSTGLQAGDTDCAKLKIQMTAGNAVNTSSSSTTCWPQ